MNIADIIVIVILGLMIVRSYRKGFLNSIVKVVATITSIILTKMLNVVVADFVRETVLFENLKNTVIKGFELDKKLSGVETLRQQLDVINSLPLPDVLKKSLLENNNSEIYNILNVESLSDYIGGYIANIVLSIITIIVLFIAAYFCVRYIFGILELLSKISILGTVNHLLGGVLGFVYGTIYIWIAMAILTVLFAYPTFSGVEEAVLKSNIASIFYDFNILLNFINKIFF